jgi:hypothetical protein
MLQNFGFPGVPHLDMQWLKKSFPHCDSSVGGTGVSLLHPMWYSTTNGFAISDHGGLPEAISMSVQPSDQMSEGVP